MIQLCTRRRARGFTLVELIVAVGLFAIIMTLAAGAYLMVIAVGRQTQAATTGINNLSFALESMTRSIRTGTHYQGTSSGSSTFIFTDQNGVVRSYQLGSQSGGAGSVGAILLTRNGVVFPLTSPAVNITSLTFYTLGHIAGGTGQPRVTMSVSGTVSSGPGKTQSFVVQTGVSMRGSDL